MASTSVTTGEPHSGQNRRRTGLPLSPVSPKVLIGPVSESEAAGMPTLSENDAPACFWQFLQWQIAVKTGSASAV